MYTLPSGCSMRQTDVLGQVKKSFPLGVLSWRQVHKEKYVGTGLCGAILHQVLNS